MCTMKMIPMIRRYSELIQLGSFEDRLNYLKLHGDVGDETFGFDRYLNQKFYKSAEWKQIRDKVILRDMGCDLACRDFPINGTIIVHHMNPMSIEDLRSNPGILLDPEFLICVSLETHNIIHYGDNNNQDYKVIVERKPNDTKLW